MYRHHINSCGDLEPFAGQIVSFSWHNHPIHPANYYTIPDSGAKYFGIVSEYPPFTPDQEYAYTLNPIVKNGNTAPVYQLVDSFIRERQPLIPYILPLSLRWTFTKEYIDLCYFLMTFATTHELQLLGEAFDNLQAAPAQKIDEFVLNQIKCQSYLCAFDCRI